jgi:hypothetical protein
LCDPTVLAVGSLVAGVAGTAADYMGQADAARKQEQAYNEWAAQQHANRVAAAAKDEQDRQVANAARVQGLSDVSAANQKTEQATEQTRLTSYLSGQDQTANEAPSTSGQSPTSVADPRLSGANLADPSVKADLADKLGRAAQDSKNRIAALAAVSSYGGSSGGLDVSNANAFAKAGEGIDLGNEFRRGDLGVYQTQQAVNPVQWSYTKSPLSGLASTALSFGSQGLGKMLGGATRIT